MSSKIIRIPNADGSTSAISMGARSIVEYLDYPIPIIHLSGNTGGMTKDDEVTLDYIYKERSGTCTLKWQGSSSVSCPKKNYTIKFDEKFEVVSSWGAQKKYVLKANYVDSSHARNILCARMWGQIVKSRTPANAKLNALVNGGAIDGFPVIVAINGMFHGLYTWNIPKDGWMLGMDETGQQAIVCAELNNNGAVAFKGLATLTEDANGQLDFDLEYSSDDKSDWVLASLNRLLAAVKDSDGTNITYGITPYLDWESAIDYFIHAVLTMNYDGIHRNYLLATYDGVKWFFTGYDMDVVLGLRAMGKYFYAANVSQTFAEIAGSHKVFELIWKYMRPQLRARYKALRAAAMSVENVANMVVDFVADIPLPVYIDDSRMWNTIHSTSANNIAQIITWYDLRCRNADVWIENTSGQTSLPTQVDPSSFAVTNTLSNCATSNSATTVSKGSAYSATITANSGYELKSVTVTMGGVDITSTAYSNGKISISAVTGALVITASAAAMAGYINQVPISIDSNKNIYNGTGWKDAYRLSSSSGSEKSEPSAAVIGFVPVKAGDIVRFKYTGAGAIWDHDTGNAANSVVYYNDSFIYLGGATPQPSIYGICTINDVPTGSALNGGIVTIVVPNNSNISYMRLSTVRVNATLDNLIVTVNQEITD